MSDELTYQRKYPEFVDLVSNLAGCSHRACTATNRWLAKKLGVCIRTINRYWERARLEGRVGIEICFPSRRRRQILRRNQRVRRTMKMLKTEEPYAKLSCPPHPNCHAIKAEEQKQEEIMAAPLRSTIVTGLFGQRSRFKQTPKRWDRSEWLIAEWMGEIFGIKLPQTGDPKRVWSNMRALVRDFKALGITTKPLIQACHDELVMKWGKQSATPRGVIDNIGIIEQRIRRRQETAGLAEMAENVRKATRSGSTPKELEACEETALWFLQEKISPSAPRRLCELWRNRHRNSEIGPKGLLNNAESLGASKMIDRPAPPPAPTRVRVEQAAPLTDEDRAALDNNWQKIRAGMGGAA